MTEAHRIAKHSVEIDGHRTSVSIEAVFWEALRHLAEEGGTSLNTLVSEIDRNRDGNLSSAIRVYVLETLQARLRTAPSSVQTPCEPVTPS